MSNLGFIFDMGMVSGSILLFEVEKASMRFGHSIALASGLLIVASSTALASPPRVHRGPTSPHLFKTRSAAAKPKGQASMSPERATEIQTALVKAGYLSGTPSGTWDKESQDAMQKLQGDNGWQTKLVPDSRAIIKLGLGPGSSPAGAELAKDASETVEAPGTGVEPPSAPANK